MKFSPLNRYKGTNKPTSFQAVFGCKEARDFHLADDNGRAREVICMPVSGGALLMPIIEKHDTLSYKGYETEVCSNGKLYFGKVLNIPQNITWKTTDPSKLNTVFFEAIDSFLETTEQPSTP